MTLIFSLLAFPLGIWLGMKAHYRKLLYIMDDTYIDANDYRELWATKYKNPFSSPKEYPDG